MLVLGAVAALRVAVWKDGLRVVQSPTPFGRTLLAFAIFSGWLLASSLWSEVARPWKVWTDFTFTTLAAGALVHVAVRAQDRALPALSSIFVGGVAAALALLIFEAATGGLLRAITPPKPRDQEQVRDLIALARGVTAVIPSAFAALSLGLAWRGRRAAPLVVGGALAALAASLGYSVDTNIVAVAGGACVFGAALIAPRWTIALVASALLLALAAAPLAAIVPFERFAENAALPASWAQRLYVWGKAGDLVIACLPFGCGADYGRAVSALGETAALPHSGLIIDVMPVHPHNLFLQIWMDLGFVGAAAAAAAVAFGAAALARQADDRPLVAGAAAIAVAVLASGLLEASLWQPWRIAAVGFGATGLALSSALRRSHLRNEADGDRKGL